MNGFCHSAETRLAVYGTLAPGRRNHHQLSTLKGRWINGYVGGRLVETGWGAAQGFPGLILDEQGDKVDVQIFESADLPAHWARLDAFEGAEYVRTEVTVQTGRGAIEASLYSVEK